MNLFRLKNQRLIPKRFLPFFILPFCFLACGREDNTEMKQRKSNFPHRSVINAHMYYKDSGRFVLDLRSRRIEEYSMVDTAYTRFPKGLELEFYNKKSDTPG